MPLTQIRSGLGSEAALVAISALWRRRLLLARFAAVGLALSTVIVFLIPAEYQSTVELMPPGWQSPESSLITPWAGMALTQSAAGGGLAGNLLGGRSASGPLMGILESRTAQEGLVARFGLQRVYRVRRLDDACRILARRTEISEDKPTGILSVTVSDRSPARARDLAGAYVDELNKLAVSMDASAAHRERVFLDARLQQIQADLHEAEVQLSSFSSRTGAMDGPEQSRVMLDAASRLQGQLIAAEGQLHALEAVYSGGNVRVESARALVSTLQTQLGKLGGTASGSPSDSGQIYPSLRQLPILGVTWADLYRRTRTLEVAMDLMSRQLEAARIEEAEQMPSVKVLDPPGIPEQKSFPPRLLLIALGTIFGLLAGAVRIVGAEVWRRMDPSDPWKRLLSAIAASAPGKGLRS